MELSKFGAWPIVLGPLVAQTAIAMTYMSEAEAVKLLFPAAAMKKATLNLSADEIALIKKRTDSGDRIAAVLHYFSAAGDVVFIDQVLGKHEMITYAVGIDKGGAVKGVEILEYRESFGFEVRRESWRTQFVGKNKDSRLELDEDIKNISGATLSSAHITQGVKRLLQTYDVARARL